MARGSENMEHYGKLGTNMHGVLVHNHHGLVPNHNIDQIIRSLVERRRRRLSHVSQAFRETFAPLQGEGNPPFQLVAFLSSLW